MPRSVQSISPSFTWKQKTISTSVRRAYLHDTVARAFASRPIKTTRFKTTHLRSLSAPKTNLPFQSPRTPTPYYPPRSQVVRPPRIPPRPEFECAVSSPRTRVRAGFFGSFRERAIGKVNDGEAFVFPGSLVHRDDRVDAVPDFLREEAEHAAFGRVVGEVLDAHAVRRRLEERGDGPRERERFQRRRRRRQSRRRRRRQSVHVLLHFSPHFFFQTSSP